MSDFLGSLNMNDLIIKNNIFDYFLFYVRDIFVS